MSKTAGHRRRKNSPSSQASSATCPGTAKDPVEYKEREFLEVEQGGVNGVMKRIAPSLKFSVPNELTGQEGSEIGVDLEFKSLDDFSPIGVASQLPETRALLETRRRLADLYGKVESNDKLDGILGDILADANKTAELREALGLDAEGDGDDATT